MQDVKALIVAVRVSRSGVERHLGKIHDSRLIYAREADVDERRGGAIEVLEDVEEAQFQNPECAFAVPIEVETVVFEEVGV